MTNYYMSTKTNLASSCTRAATSRRRPAQNYAFIAHPVAGHVLAWEVFALATAFSLPALSDSSELNLNAAGLPRRGGPQATVSE